MIRRERQPFCVEIIDGQIAIGMNDDGPCAFFDGLGINSVRKPLLDDCGDITKVAFGLRKQIANGHGFPRATLAEQNWRCWGVLLSAEPENVTDANEIILWPVVNRLGGRQVSGEGAAGHRQHVGEENGARNKVCDVRNVPHVQPRPGLEEKTFGGAGGRLLSKGIAPRSSN